MYAFVALRFIQNCSPALGFALVLICVFVHLVLTGDLLEDNFDIDDYLSSELRIIQAMDFDLYVF